MNGASALDCAKISRMPNKRNTNTIGISQYFFSWRRKVQNSARTRALPMLSAASVHPRIMFRVAIPRRIGRPAAAADAAAAERILAGQTPQQAERHQQQREEDGQ